MPFPIFILQNVVQRDAPVPRLLSGKLRLPETALNTKIPICP
jgi:hypothetical protein